jgi:hypothetical protein
MKELQMVGNLNVEQVQKVLDDCRAHGDYDLLKVSIYKDGTGEIHSSAGVSAEIQFEDFS